MAVKRYSDLHEYLFLNRREVNKTELARSLGVWPSKLTTLLNPERYRVAIDEDLAQRIAALLNQTPEYVRRLYNEAA